MRGILSTRPWQVAQPTPFLTWMLWVEIHEIRQVVDARPVKRRVIAEAGPHRFEDGRIGPELRMAIHAGLGRRKLANADSSTVVWQ